MRAGRAALVAAEKSTAQDGRCHVLVFGATRVACRNSTREATLARDREWDRNAPAERLETDPTTGLHFPPDRIQEQMRGGWRESGVDEYRVNERHRGLRPRLPTIPSGPTTLRVPCTLSTMSNWLDW